MEFAITTISMVVHFNWQMALFIFSIIRCIRRRSLSSYLFWAPGSAPWVSFCTSGVGFESCRRGSHASSTTRRTSTRSRLSNDQLIQSSTRATRNKYQPQCRSGRLLSVYLTTAL